MKRETETETDGNKEKKRKRRERSKRREKRKQKEKKTFAAISAYPIQLLTAAGSSSFHEAAASCSNEEADQYG